MFVGKRPENGTLREQKLLYMCIFDLFCILYIMYIYTHLHMHTLNLLFPLTLLERVVGLCADAGGCMALSRVPVPCAAQCSGSGSLPA